MVPLYYAQFWVKIIPFQNFYAQIFKRVIFMGRSEILK